MRWFKYIGNLLLQYPNENTKGRTVFIILAMLWGFAVMLGFEIYWFFKH